MTGLGWPEPAPEGDNRTRRVDLAQWWGRCALNRVADDAGRYRRIATGLAAASGPLLVAAIGCLVHDGRPAAAAALAYAAAAIGAAWLAADLVRTGSVLGAGGAPHPSSLLLVGGIALLVVSTRAQPTVSFGTPMLLVAGLAALVGGFLVLMAAERNQDRFLFTIGRWSVVWGAVLVGAMELGRAVPVYPSAPIEAVGLGLVAISLLTMAWFEARILWRGVALSRALAQR